MTSGSPWRLSWRADPAARALADRHYSRQSRHAPQFVPPGRCLVLLSADRSALWVTSWPLAEYARHAWAGAWVCSLFRNEGAALSSALITHAVAHTRAHWPAVPAGGIVTFVDPGKSEPKAVPGWCFLRAGWSHVGFTKGGLWVYQQMPGRRVKRRGKPMPAAAPVPGAQTSLLDDQEGAA
jgi:hypothetical protein